MEKKILRAQLYSLFILTTLNLIYFYYREDLPDNYYEITYQNASINFFSYYFFSILANFGYWCGVWVTVSFVVFALLNSLVFSKNNDMKNQATIGALLPLTVCLCYMLLPGTLGEGLQSLIRSEVDVTGIVTCTVFFGLSFFYLASEKHFFKVSKWVWRQCATFADMVKTADYSTLRKLHIKAQLSGLKDRILEFRNSSTPGPAVAIPVGLKITESPKIEPKLHHLRETKQIVKKVKKDQEELEDEEFNDKVEKITEEEGDEDKIEDGEPQFNDAEIGPEDEEEAFEDGEFEEVESPYQQAVKPRAQDKFFASDELINCIAPKGQSKQISDPDEEYFVTIARAIEEKLKQFNISAQIINVLKGPVVDTFELKLGEGVQVSKVTNRTDDLSLALMGAPIRMVYPMKGKSTIGIEVPRNPRDVIFLDEVLRSPNFNNSNYKLPIAMGKDAYGDAAVIDLASTPHLLVAGTTGAGKSVFVNTLLVSLIIKFSPKKLRLIMLDPKQLELALYQRLPHLVMPVVTNPEIASAALLWAIDEMERRYSLLKDFAVKNIEGFNKKLMTAGTDLTCKIPKYYPDAETKDFELPYMVIVVDEFADLMLSKSGKAIETSISRLAAKARASGIHIVLATQRPSTDIITGVIKANFPTRVSFRVFTNIDSRVILDGMGAEKLLGKGDMLFKQGIDILRMHSAYVDENEIEAWISFQMQGL
jgi:S-DNA-T family DNA segregation ATPase FtsK/SpoIIIE